MERLVFLGTGEAMATRCYNACFILQTPGCNLLVDAGGGNGILRQLEKVRIDISDIDAIFITHAHTDHLLGVVWVLRMIGEKIEAGVYKRQCKIYGNSNVIDLLCSIIFKSFSPGFCRNILKYVELELVEDGYAIRLPHGTVLNVFDTNTDTPQLGFKATLPSGTTIACCGDAPLSRVAPSAVKDSDWLIAEAFCLERDRDRFHPERINHGTVSDTARIAQAFGVKNLIIYHSEDSDLANRKNRYCTEASGLFAGAVFVPDDLEIIGIAR